MSADENSSVFQLVSYAWAGLSAAFGPLIILSLYRRHITKFVAMAGMVVGAVMVLVWKQLDGGVFELFES
ncbi:MAG: hypothetical protein U9N86_14870 [Bacteroidota bacterium]|nr:hypothetical protein [Bacteroidota bacterium]